MGSEISKDSKQLKFESRLKSKIEDCRTSFTVIFNHAWTSNLGWEFQKFQKSFKFETQPQIED